MTFSEAVAKSFKLWWKTLSSVLVFSFIAALINNWPYFLHINTENLQLSTHYLLIMVVAGLINLIPSNAIFARLGHALHDQPITLSQSIAVSLVKLPQTAFWLLIVFALIYIPMYFSSSLPEAQTSLWVFLAVAYIIFLIIAGIYCTLIFPLIILGNHSFISAIKKSFQLIKGKWWLTGVVLSAPVFIAAIFEVLLRILFKDIGAVIGMTLFLPLNIATITVLYEYYNV